MKGVCLLAVVAPRISCTGDMDSGICKEPDNDMKKLHFNPPSFFWLMGRSLLVFPFFFLALTLPLSGRGESVIGVRTVRRMVPANGPHARPFLKEFRGSGFPLQGGYIATDIELVRDAVSVEVSHADHPEPVKARIAHLGIDCGMALLQVEDEQFLKGVPLLEPGTEPEGLTFTADFLGYGKTGQILTGSLRLQKGGVRTIEGSDVDARPLYLLTGNQTDPDPFVSGGPILHNGKLLGMFHHGKRTYIIPHPVLNHVLQDVADNSYDGFPHPGFFLQKTVNPNLRQALKLPAARGVLVRRVLFQSGAWNKLQTGDLLLKINGLEIDSQGMVKTENGLLGLGGYVASLQRGEYGITFQRGERVEEQKIGFSSFPGYAWQRRRLNHERHYFLSGGLLFQELDFEIRHRSEGKKSDLLRYRYHYYFEDQLSETSDLDVILTLVLPDTLNTAARRFQFCIVRSLNDQPVRNLQDLARIWRSTRDEFLTIRFRNRPEPLILPRVNIAGANQRILKKYGVHPNEIPAR